MTVEKGKSPWAYGDEAEKKLGLEKVQQLRRERALKAGEEDLGSLFDVMKGMSESGFVLEPNFEFEHFLLYLKDHGGTFSKTYPVTPEGHVEDRAYHQQTPDLLSKIRTKEDFATVEDLRQTALRITEKFPQISFTFEESPARDKISYTVKLEEAGE